MLKGVWKCCFYWYDVICHMMSTINPKLQSKDIFTACLISVHYDVLSHGGGISFHRGTFLPRLLATLLQEGRGRWKWRVWMRNGTEPLTWHGEDGKHILIPFQLYLTLLSLKGWGWGYIALLGTCLSVAFSTLSSKKRTKTKEWIIMCFYRCVSILCIAVRWVHMLSDVTSFYLL